MSDRPTPLTDANVAKLPKTPDCFCEADFARDLERKLAEAREALQWARENMGKHTRPSPIDRALARIDAKGKETA